MEISPKRYQKRSPQHRIFVNRSLRLDRITYYGFDMDHTLAVYVSPQFDELCFELIIKSLIRLGYPQELKQFKYDPSFTLRGLWLDKKHGTLLKVDPYGIILKCSFGLRFLRSSEIQKLYPNNFVTFDSNIFILNTLFNSPEAFIYSCVIEHYVNCGEFSIETTGIRSENVFMSYRNIAEDIRTAIDQVHASGGDLKKHTLENLNKFIVKDIAIPTWFKRMKECGKKTFLLTNSDYSYSNGIMSYLFDFPELGEKDWKSYFDLIVVDAQKPRFFENGTVLRQVNPENGSLHIGSYVGPMKKGQVYSGGSAEVITALFEASGKDVLYFGDHIHGDVIRSKKLCGWRTFLIVPELAQEIDIWVDEKDLFDKMDSLANDLNECYLDLDSKNDVASSELQNKIQDIKKLIRETSHDIDSVYGQFGSLFRTGSRQTFFAAQTVRYADLYAPSFINLINYPFSYFFRAPVALMPHEQTIEHGDSRSSFFVAGGNLVSHLIQKDSQLTNTLTSPLVARQHVETIDQYPMTPNTPEEAPVSIPTGKVLLRRQTPSMCCNHNGGDKQQADKVATLNSVRSNEGGESSGSSDTEE